MIEDMCFFLFFSELQISKTCNSLFRKQIIDLEWSSLDNAEYLRREIIKISPVPLEVSNNELRLVCKALSLTGNEVYPDDLEACHRISRKKKMSSSNSKSGN